MPPNFQRNRAISLVVLAIFTLLLISAIVVPTNFSASSLPVAAVSGVISILGMFFSFLQAFPSVRDSLIQFFSITHFPTPNRNQWLLGLLVFILIVLNVIQAGIIFGQRKSETSQLTPTARATAITATSNINTSTIPTSTPTSFTTTANLLYQADWSQGLNSWHGGSQWSVNNGMLMSNGETQGKYYIVAPYQPTVSNYAIEAQIQFLQNTSFPDPKVFGLFVRSGPNEDERGYDGYVFGGDAKIRIAHDPNSLILGATPYTLDTGLHIYRLEVKDSTITLLIDGVEMVQATDSTFSAPGLLGVYDNSCQINVRSFEVFQL